jgi:hypothetical protein
MSNTANTFLSLQGMMHEAYADGNVSHSHPNNKKFKKIKEMMGNKKCGCAHKKPKCECKGK